METPTRPLTLTWHWPWERWRGVGGGGGGNIRERINFCFGMKVHYNVILLFEAWKHMHSVMK